MFTFPGRRYNSSLKQIRTPKSGSYRKMRGKKRGYGNGRERGRGRKEGGGKRRGKGKGRGRERAFNLLLLPAALGHC